jgi:transposase
MPVNTVCGVIDENKNKIWRMLEKYVDMAREHEDLSAVTSVGMDETSRAKGHDYVTLFVDLEERRTIFVAEDKDHKTVEAFADDLKTHYGSPDQISDVICDMSPAFIKSFLRDHHYLIIHHFLIYHKLLRSYIKFLQLPFLSHFLWFSFSHYLHS